MKKNFFIFILFLTILTYSTVSPAYGLGVTIDSGLTLSVNNGTLTVPDDITINGTLESTTGTINAGGDFINNGTFISGTGTVNLTDGQTPADISGSNQFYTLNASTTSGKQINFEANPNPDSLQLSYLPGRSWQLIGLKEQ